MDIKGLPHELEQALELFRLAERSKHAQAASISFLKALDCLDRYIETNPNSPFEERIRQIKLSNNRMLIREFIEKEPIGGTRVLECLNRTRRETEFNISQDPDLKEKYDMAMGYLNATQGSSRTTSRTGHAEDTLYRTLLDSNLSFIPKGEHHIRDIYSVVKDQFERLCNDSYLCSENCTNGNNQPEWMHIVRNVMQKLKSQGKIERGDQHGYWLLGVRNSSRESRKVEVVNPRESEKVPTKNYKTAKLLEVISKQSKEGKIDWEDGEDENVYRANFSGSALSIGCQDDSSYFVCIESVQGNKEIVHDHDATLNQLLDSSKVMKEIYGQARAAVIGKKGIEQTIDNILLELGGGEEDLPISRSVSPPKNNLKDLPEGLQQVFEVCKRVWEDSYSYPDAISHVARTREVAKQTVIDKCTRKLKINTDSFLELLSNKHRLANHLIMLFPKYANTIRGILRITKSESTIATTGVISAIRTQDNVSYQQELSPKKKGKLRRDEFLQAVRDNGVMLSHIGGVRYRSGRANLIGIASASMGKHNTWFLGIRADDYHSIVLLCEDDDQHVYNFILSKQFLNERMRFLSKDENDQLKFRIRRKSEGFFIDIPSWGHINVDDFIDKYENLN